MSQMLESFSNPSQKDQIEERMTRIREDPSLKPILEEIESGGPAAMMRLVIVISSILLLLAYKNGEKLEDCCYVLLP
jgi:hypothetical protein